MTANKGLLPAQAGQQVFGVPSAKAVPGCTLCCCRNWILQMTVDQQKILVSMSFARPREKMVDARSLNEGNYQVRAGSHWQSCNLKLCCLQGSRTNHTKTTWFWPTPTRIGPEPIFEGGEIWLYVDSTLWKTSEFWTLSNLGCLQLKFELSVRCVFEFEVSSPGVVVWNLLSSSGLLITLTTPVRIREIVVFGRPEFFKSDDLRACDQHGQVDFVRELGAAGKANTQLWSSWLLQSHVASVASIEPIYSCRWHRPVAEYCLVSVIQLWFSTIPIYNNWLHCWSFRGKFEIFS